MRLCRDVRCHRHWGQSGREHRSASQRRTLSKYNLCTQCMKILDDDCVLGLVGLVKNLSQSVVSAERYRLLLHRMPYRLVNKLSEPAAQGIIL